MGGSQRREAAEEAGVYSGTSEQGRYYPKEQYYDCLYMNSNENESCF
jgi:hypothetical protein